MSNYPGFTRKQRERLERYERELKQQGSSSPQQSKVQATAQPPKSPRPEASKTEDPPNTPSENPGLVVGSLKNVLNMAGGLSDGERAMLNRLLLRYEAEQKEVKKAAKIAKMAAREDERQKQRQEKQLRFSWQRERAETIEKTHKVSGFKSSPGLPLQGGAPGLGKNS